MKAEQKSPELSLNDLASIRNLIEVVTQRGAFKANELSSVGVLFDKLNVFLEASLAKQQEEQASPAQGE
jgi:hypothetical protein